MTKKKEKELIRKPDVFLTLFTETTQFIRLHSRQCIAALVIFLLACAAGYVYIQHSRSQYDKIQYQLSQGVQSFAAYSVEGKQEDINKAEGIFNEIAQKKKGKSYYIAKLYLAKIQYLKGKSEDAKKIYQEILKGTSDSMLKTLSERAIQHLDKKQ